MPRVPTHETGPAGELPQALPAALLPIGEPALREHVEARVSDNGRVEEKKLKVEVWSDLICPWCGLGDHRLDAALERFAHRDDVEVVHKSFQLDPSAPPGETRPVREYLAKKGMPAAQLEASQDALERMAADEGLKPYIVRDNVVGSTRLAHELLAYAASKGKGDEAWRRLFRAYFGEKRSIFDLPSLLDLADELGLDRDDARAALESHRHAPEVDRDLLEARALGIQGVPFFVVDRRYGVSGAQPADTLLEVLETAYEERRPQLTMVNGDGEVCGPDGCEVPGGE